MTGYAELICIHSLQDNWRKGYGSKMMEQILRDMEKAKEVRGAVEVMYEK